MRAWITAVWLIAICARYYAAGSDGHENLFELTDNNFGLYTKGKDVMLVAFFTDGSK